MSKSLALLFALAVIVVVVPRAAAQSKSVPVFVTSAGAANGFTDPNKDNQDTMKDLRDSLKGRKGIVLTDRREDAGIVLVVQSREKAQLTASPLGGILGGGPSRDCTVRVKFIYKDTETEMSGSANGGALMSGGAWSKAAGKVAKQVEQWIDANRTKL
jgi:hypothetical protein